MPNPPTHDDRGPTGPLPAGPELSAGRQTARFVMRPLAFMEEMWRQFGDVFTVRLADEPPWVLVCAPELIGTIFAAPADVLHAGEAKEVLRPVLGDHSVLLLDEEAHMGQRLLLLPAFGGNRLEGYEEAMRTAALRALDRWPLDSEAPALEWTEEIALEVILTALFGRAGDARIEALRDSLRLLQLPGNTVESRRPRLTEAVGQIDELIFAEIAARREMPANGTAADMLGLLLESHYEDGSEMSSVEIRDELVSLLIAGHETTAITLAWALELLARHPDCLEEIAAEAGEGGGPYTDAAIAETLRLRPALPVVARAVKAPFELGGHTIPAGTVLVPAILLVHHRPDLYPDPGAFRPERFLDRRPDPRTWIPFGGGGRRCLGAGFAMREMRVVLAALLERVSVHPVGGREEAMRSRSVTLTPARGAPVVLRARRGPR